MSAQNTFKSIVISLSIGLAAASGRAQIAYSVTDLGINIVGGVSTFGLAINNAGQVAGSRIDPISGNQRASFYSSETGMFDLGSLMTAAVSAPNSSATAINSVGTVAGWSDVIGSGRHPIIAKTISGQWEKSDLGALGDSAWANGINTSGEVVGEYYFNFDSTIRSFVFRGGSYHTLGSGNTNAMAINDAGQITGSILGKAFIEDHGIIKNLGTLTGGTFSSGDAINAAGQVTGQSNLSADTLSHAFLYDGTSMLDLGTLPGFNADGRGINNNGVVVGTLTSTSISGRPHAFVYSGGAMRDLNSLVGPLFTWTITAATGVNDNGLITGYAISSDGVTHAIILTPVPEPLTAALLGAGLLAATLRRPKR